MSAVRVDKVAKEFQLGRATFIFSTHDPRVMVHANRVVRLADGKIVEA